MRGKEGVSLLQMESKLSVELTGTGKLHEGGGGNLAVWGKHKATGRRSFVLTSERQSSGGKSIKGGGGAFPSINREKGTQGAEGDILISCMEVYRGSILLGPSGAASGSKQGKKTRQEKAFSLG